MDKLQEICRCCFSNNVILTDVNNADGSGFKHIDKLKFVAGTVFDAITTSICRGCCNKLHTAYTFKQSCLKSEQLLDMYRVHLQDDTDKDHRQSHAYAQIKDMHEFNGQQPTGEKLFGLNTTIPNSTINPSRVYTGNSVEHGSDVIKQKQINEADTVIDHIIKKYVQKSSESTQINMTQDAAICENRIREKMSAKNNEQTQPKDKTSLDEFHPSSKVERNNILTGNKQTESNKQTKLSMNLDDRSNDTVIKEEPQETDISLNAIKQEVDTNTIIESEVYESDYMFSNMTADEKVQFSFVKTEQFVPPGDDNSVCADSENVMGSINNNNDGAELNEIKNSCDSIDNTTSLDCESMRIVRDDVSSDSVQSKHVQHECNDGELSSPIKKIILKKFVEEVNDDTDNWIETKPSSGEEPSEKIDIVDEFKLEQVNATDEISAHVKQYPCNKCDRSFRSLPYLKVHKASHVIKKYQCDVCDRKYSHKSSLRLHMETHSGTKQFQCEQCGKCFHSRMLLNSHMRTHTQEKPFSCDVCGKRFNWRSNLADHRRIHTSNKPYECKICLRTFNQRATLHKHVLLHSRDRMHRCKFCKAEFKLVTDLDLHKMTHTELTWLRCHYCDRVYDNKRKLHEHISGGCKVRREKDPKQSKKAKPQPRPPSMVLCYDQNSGAVHPLQIVPKEGVQLTSRIVAMHVGPKVLSEPIVIED